MIDRIGYLLRSGDDSGKEHAAFFVSSFEHIFITNNLYYFIFFDIFRHAIAYRRKMH